MQPDLEGVYFLLVSKKSMFGSKYIGPQENFHRSLISYTRSK